MTQQEILIRIQNLDLERQQLREQLLRLTKEQWIPKEPKEKKLAKK